MEIVLEDSENDEQSILINQSSSSDDENEEEALNLYVALTLSKKRKKIDKRPRVEGFVERIIPGYTAKEFKTHFRLLPTTFDFILRLIGANLNSTKSVAGRKPIPAQNQLLMALWMIATPDRSVCTKFDLGKATAIRAMRRVTHALHKLAPRFIQWPQGRRAIEVMEAFERVSGFPNVIGAIDGTHIEIRSPQGVDHQAYTGCQNDTEKITIPTTTAAARKDFPQETLETTSKEEGETTERTTDPGDHLKTA
ncbi:Putative nuclease HARBI1 [Trachymyrmex cornetzi]|uniref:Putative nuclease HARBI1 n=1 Tax=Trachymyrmex cornetzi TaxID=471704 RepID=A0A151JCD1_9HYME|nr:Putative nuclease HARBI1 [Trachymyrmex cornetzi]